MRTGFSPSQIRLLTAPQRWKLITSVVEPQGRLHCPPAHRVWRRDHLHSHSRAELLFVLRGEGFWGLRDKVYPLGPGVVVFFAPSEPHDREYRPGAGGGEHLWLHILPHAFLAYLYRSREGDDGFVLVWREVLAPADVGVLPQLFLDAGRDVGALNVPIQRARFLGAAAVLCSAVAQTRERRPSESDRGDQREMAGNVLSVVQEHIRQTAGRGVTLEGLARLAGYSKYHFLRLFTRHVGMTVHQYINACRLRRVRELMELGWTKKAISADLGFSDPSAFSRWEHRHMGDQQP